MESRLFIGKKMEMGVKMKFNCLVTIKTLSEQYPFSTQEIERMHEKIKKQFKINDEKALPILKICLKIAVADVISLDTAVAEFKRIVLLNNMIRGKNKTMTYTEAFEALGDALHDFKLTVLRELGMFKVYDWLKSKLDRRRIGRE
jgi:hypothetical protein